MKYIPAIHLVVSMLVCFIVGCSDQPSVNERLTPPQNKERKTFSNDEEEKRVYRTACAHFNRPNSTGWYVEKRGEYFFVSPPYKRAADIERTGIYIDGKDGKIVIRKK